MTRPRFFRFLAGFFTLLIIPLIINSCKPDSTITSTGISGGSGTTAQKSTISGQVINFVSGIPLDSVLVRITGAGFNTSLLTDSQGKYSADFNIASNINFTIIATKSNYVGDTTAVTLTPGGSITPSVLSMTPSGGSVVPSGDPVSIYLLSQSNTSIGVKGSGASEVASVVFQVVDSSGTAIDLTHSVNVSFKLGASPGGGEVVSPSVVQTNNLGQATVNVTSGTKAGVVQFIAIVDLGTDTLQSTPVSVAITGGLPDINHFSVIPSLVNLAGYDIFGNTMTVSVVVGDKYSNPVRPNTSVSFNTTGGVIGGSTQTDIDGKGSVILTSGNPRPSDPLLGPGFAVIEASTADENQLTISKQIYVLFSGTPSITGLTPATFNIPNGGSQYFTYTVADENGNPLAGGTSIIVTVTGNNVEASGDIDVTLPDTQSKTWTNFGFTIADNDTTNVASTVTIKIEASGPNGKAKVNASGTSH